MVRRTKEEAQATRSHILDTAEQVFERHGVSGTSLHEIAKAAGLTRGAIYWHFENKADLFNAMMERVTLPLEETDAIGGFKSHDITLAQVRIGFVEVLRKMTTDPQLRRVFDIATHKVEYTHDMESVQQRHLTVRNACVIDFEKAMVGDARRAGKRLPIPAAAAAQGLHALITGLIQNWLLDPAAFDLVATGRQAFRVYLAGLGFTRPVASAG